ncbi:MAG TPA: O-antigen ligase family protein, partial [Patescibacteria group bacterium]|nr:O-antigen ligase family protein [Patescibacteria group bacterium]
MKQINQQIARYLRYSLWVCLYLILLTPLLIGNDFIFPFISLKTFFFRILVEIGLLLYFLLALLDANYRPRFNKLTGSILIFGVIVLITSLTGVNPYRSFWGTIERGEGFLTVSHIILWCFLLIQMFRTRQQWLNYFCASVTVSFLVGLYALAQVYTHISWVIGADGRLSSTLGNAAYLGAYSLGHFWLCLILLFERKKVYWRALFAVLAAFELFILWRSETRGALLSLGLVLLILLVISAITNRDRRIKIFSMVVLFIILTSSFFAWSNRHAEWVKKSNTLSRLANISLNDTTTESRLLAWNSSWRGWQERFMLGYGWENYNIAFNKYFHAEIFRDNGSQIWFDRAHNTVFDVAVASGLI